MHGWHVSTGKAHRKKQGENYAEAVVHNYTGEEESEFEELYFKVTAYGGIVDPATKDENGNIVWSLTNVTKDITIDMDSYPAYNEKTVADNWIGDLIRVQPKGGCTALKCVEFYIHLHHIL